MVHFDVMVPCERAGKLGTRGCRQRDRRAGAIAQRGALNVDCEQRTFSKCGRV
jgi:hypothetical protein